MKSITLMTKTTQELTLKTSPQAKEQYKVYTKVKAWEQHTLELTPKEVEELKSQLKKNRLKSYNELCEHLMNYTISYKNYENVDEISAETSEGIMYDSIINEDASEDEGYTIELITASSKNDDEWLTTNYNEI